MFWFRLNTATLRLGFQVETSIRLEIITLWLFEGKGVSLADRAFSKLLRNSSDVAILLCMILSTFISRRLLASAGEYFASSTTCPKDIAAFKKQVAAKMHESINVNKDFCQDREFIESDPEQKNEELAKPPSWNAR
jgi:hypothetical protein